jgi:hypothetical protein
MKKTIEQTIAAMLTENTGKNMLDSGGDYGRAWQRNMGKTVDDFMAKPSATAEIYVREWKGETVAEVVPCVDIFHLLTSGVLELDELCHVFNAKPVDDWDGDFLGVSIAGWGFLNKHGFTAEGDGFNTYNWASNHSQVMQGQELKLDGEYGEETYLLLQIHGGADVRGGYTDAKLFKLDYHAEIYNVFNEDCGFCDDSGEHSIDWRGEFITREGGCASDEEVLAFALACGASLENPSVVVPGDAYLDY